MIHSTLLMIISLLLVIFLLMMIGEKLRIAYPIFLVLGGLSIGFVSWIPDIEIEPDLVFLIFLPPLLYEAAWSTSWHEFWKNSVHISSLGFGLVIFTSGIVAYFCANYLGEFSVALGFLLGGIISPPDAVAATSVLKSIKVPKRLLTVLEGESLVNDASSLIVVRFALAAVTASSTFVLKDAVSDFAMVTFGGIFIGVAIAFVIYIVHKFMPTNTNMDVALTLVSPYLMYLGAEHFHTSGVMAVVCGGLFLSYRYRDFLNYASHMQAMSTWKTIAFVFNGFVFILIGLELPVLIKRMSPLELEKGIRYGLWVSLVVVCIRIFWVYAFVKAQHLFVRVRQGGWLGGGWRAYRGDSNWRNLFVVGWAGMRGVVSLAAALAIPFELPDGTPFPHRDLILLMTFVVILVTLVFQGFTLPFVIKFLGINPKQAELALQKEEDRMELRLMSFVARALEDKYAEDIAHNGLLKNYKASIETGIQLAAQRAKVRRRRGWENADEGRYRAVMRDMINLQRKELRMFRRANIFEDELIRKKETQLDLLEARLIAADFGESKH